MTGNAGDCAPDVRLSRLQEARGTLQGRASLPSTPIATAGVGSSDWQREALLGASEKQRALLGVRPGTASAPASAASLMPERRGAFRTPLAGIQADMMRKLGIEAPSTSAKNLQPRTVLSKGKRPEGPRDSARGPYGGEAPRATAGEGNPSDPSKHRNASYMQHHHAVTTSWGEGNDLSTADGSNDAPLACAGQRPWWLLLPDFVPVEALARGIDPRWVVQLKLKSTSTLHELFSV